MTPLLLVAHGVIEANQILKDSTTLRKIADNPQMYEGEKVQTYGTYFLTSTLTSPTEYQLIHEDRTLYVTKCNNTDRTPTGEQVFIKGEIQKMNYTKWLKPEMPENFDEFHREGKTLKMKTNDTAYVLDCEKLIN